MSQTIPVDIPDEYYQINQQYAKEQGLNPSSLLGSVIKSYVEWYIPVKSFDPVTVPKKMLGTLFEMVGKEIIETLTEQWAIESRNIVLLSGATFTTETAMDFVYKISKYFRGADAKLIKSRDKDDVISFIIRHDGGERFSYFCALCFNHFFNFFPLRKVLVNHDNSCVY